MVILPEKLIDMLTPEDIRTIRQLFREVVREEITQQKREDKTGFFADNQIYNLADDNVLLRLGVVELKNPTPVIKKRLTSAGILFTTRQRSGTTATGSELNKYLRHVANKEKSHLSKN